MPTDPVEPNEPSRPEADENGEGNQTGGGSAKDPTTRKSPVEPPKN
jgi:hypothetical protein